MLQMTKREPRSTHLPLQTTISITNTRTLNAQHTHTLTHTVNITHAHASGPTRTHVNTPDNTHAPQHKNPCTHHTHRATKGSNKFCQPQRLFVCAQVTFLSRFIFCGHPPGIAICQKPELVREPDFVSLCLRSFVLSSPLSICVQFSGCGIITAVHHR